MGCALLDCCFYCFWSTVTFIGCAIVYVVTGKEKETFLSQNELKFWILSIRFVYKLMRHRKQGVLTIPDSLRYVAEGGDERCSLKITPNNHKVSVKNLRLDKDHIRRYISLLGSQGNRIPLCYPETLFFKLIFELITSSKFCLSPLGLIHVRQTIVQNTALEEYYGADLAADADVVRYRKGEKDVEVDIRLRLFAIGKRGSLWEGVVTLLSRSSDRKSRQRNREADRYPYTDTIDVPGNVGVQYAKLTGDWNPHHLYRWSAWLLGYKRPIAHGMWTLAKAIAKLQADEDCVSDVKTEVTCSFKCPLYLPGRMRIHFDPPYVVNSSQGCRVLVEDAVSGLPHIEMTIKVL